MRPSRTLLILSLLCLSGLFNSFAGAQAPLRRESGEDKVDQSEEELRAFLERVQECGSQLEIRLRGHAGGTYENLGQVYETLRNGIIQSTSRSPDLSRRERRRLIEDSTPLLLEVEAGLLAHDLDQLSAESLDLGDLLDEWQEKLGTWTEQLEDIVPETEEAETLSEQRAHLKETLENLQAQRAEIDRSRENADALSAVERQGLRVALNDLHEAAQRQLEDDHLLRYGCEPSEASSAAFFRAETRSGTHATYHGIPSDGTSSSAANRFVKDLRALENYCIVANDPCQEHPDVRRAKKLVDQTRSHLVEAVQRDEPTAWEFHDPEGEAFQLLSQCFPDQKELLAEAHRAEVARLQKRVAEIAENEERALRAAALANRPREVEAHIDAAQAPTSGPPNASAPAAADQRVETTPAPPSEPATAVEIPATRPSIQPLSPVANGIGFDVWQSAWDDFSEFGDFATYARQNHLTEVNLNIGMPVNPGWADRVRDRLQKLLGQLRAGGVRRVNLMYAELGHPIGLFAEFLARERQLGIDTIIDDSEFTDAASGRFSRNLEEVRRHGIRYGAFVTLETKGNSGVSDKTRHWVLREVDEPIMMSYFGCTLASQKEWVAPYLEYADRVRSTSRDVKIALLMGGKSVGREYSCETTLGEREFQTFLLALHRWALRYRSYGGIVLESNRRLPKYRIADRPLTFP